MKDDCYFKIYTTLNKDTDEPTVIEFSVSLSRSHRMYPGSRETNEPVLAQIQGILLQPEYLPNNGDEWYFNVFRRRGGEAMKAFQILADEKSLLEERLKSQTLIDDCDCVAYFESVWVDQSLRGQGLALRLMREAQHMLGRFGLIAMIKAHPDGEGVTDTDCVKLAKYYQSNRQLGFSALSETIHPGWLVSYWGEPVVNRGDEMLFNPNGQRRIV
jgi:hypothetical protein